MSLIYQGKSFRQAAEPPYMGTTLYVGDKPILVIGKTAHGYTGEDTRGQVREISDKIPWESAPATERSAIIAATRVEGPLVRGSQLSGLRVGNLMFADGEWDVREGATDKKFPLDDFVLVSEEFGYDSLLIFVGAEPWVPEPAESHHSCPECGSTEVYKHGDGVECEHCGWYGDDYELADAGEDPDPDRYSFLAPREAQGQPFTIQGQVVGTPGIAEGIVVRPDRQSKEEILAVMNAMPTHADDAERYRQYMLDNHNVKHFENPQINRGGSILRRSFDDGSEWQDDESEASDKYLFETMVVSDFKRGPGGQGYTYAPSVIVVSEYVTPDDNWLLYSGNIGGIIAEIGSQTSHGVVVARDENIPIVVNVDDGHKIQPGDKVQMSGDTGVIHVNGGDNPDAGRNAPGQTAHAGILRFIWSNGHGEAVAIDPQNPDAHGTLHPDLMAKMQAEGTLDWNDAILGVVYDDGSVDLSEEAADPQAMEAWVKTVAPSAMTFNVKDFSAYGLGGTSSVKWAEAEHVLKCPDCGSHTVKALDIKKDSDEDSKFACLACKKEFKHKVYTPATAAGPSWQSITSPEELDAYMKQPKTNVPDLTPGDVIAAYPDGTIVLDDGITTWNPERAKEFAAQHGWSKEGAAKFGPGNRIEVIHKSRKGQKGLIVEESGTDDATDETLYTVLLESGDTVEGLRESDLMKIKSSMQKGAPYPKNDDEVDHSAPGHKIPKKVNEIYNAIKREHPEYSKEKAMRIAWERSGLHKEESVVLTVDWNDAAMMAGGLASGKILVDQARALYSRLRQNGKNPQEAATEVARDPRVYLNASVDDGDLTNQLIAYLQQQDERPDDLTRLNHLANKVADTNGHDLQAGLWYTMYSTQYTVPDLIHILSVEPTEVQAAIEGDNIGMFPITITAEDVANKGYSFEPHAAEPDKPVEPAPKTTKVAKAHFTYKQQQELINESMGETARNFHKLDLAGTHYNVQELEKDSGEEDMLWFW